MARRALRPRLARLLLCLAMSWMTTAVADTSLEEQLDSQATVDPRFPYCSCYRLPANPSPYNFAPTVTVKGKGQYCFKILVNSTGCTGRCCNVDLNKIEFDVNAKCLAKSASVKATINGKFTLVGPNYYTYQLDNGTYRYVLRLTSLTMGLSDNNAELCLNLTAGVNDAGCGTLEELCVPPSVSSPPGTCQVALLNSLNSTDTCCPIRYQFLVNEFTTIVSALNLTMSTAFAVDPSKCLPTTITVCGTFDEKPVIIDQLADSMKYAVDAVVRDLMNEFCALSSGMSVFLDTDGNCFDVLSSSQSTRRLFDLSPQSTRRLFDLSSPWSCSRPPTPFPMCKCNQRVGITPFYSPSSISMEPGRLPSTTLYCFIIDQVPNKFLKTVPSCGPTGVLDKVEVYADEKRRRNITGIRVTPSGGPTRWLSPSWGANGTNTLKVTPLSWNTTRAVGSSVCLELTVPLYTFCQGTNVWPLPGCETHTLHIVSIDHVDLFELFKSEGITICIA
ncbi:hypothetical protein VOLCADRAFT_91798 [Volvox carteri f. nagariensis]|uniref:Pherophorin domain-containing protein n=1 Tax=Volvox carteri f. nagariensis TaxID=3068 RepID=D8TXZ4_VOLCA|nr:uncharacterized protein VOLCADRAFT_91798 [Volvox carteri f. nagariensis]EFJ47810.1 hypothetical protein VOLCADRAFT_91798 [Volvox carteri f. nagariensis]|eukprot:XP_002951281.1 hypothetical protein VOLCADRAFT_91798 [Volvox carteri f. nagariensis]